MNNEEVLKQIKELMPQVSPDWADTLAEKMGKSVQSIYAYARGERGVRAGHHKTVLQHLKEMVAEDQKRTKKLLAL